MSALVFAPLARTCPGVPALFVLCSALPETPKRLRSVCSEHSRPSPRAQCCQARVGAQSVSIKVEGRAQGSQEGRAGRAPWPVAQFYAASRQRARLSAPRLWGPIGSLASQRPRRWTGAEKGAGRGRNGGAQSAAPASPAGLGDSAPILGHCHAVRTPGHKGISTFSLGPSAQRTSVTHMVKTAGALLVQCQYRSTSGCWSGWALLLPPLNVNCSRWTRYWFSAPRAWGRASASLALTRNSARFRGAKRAPQSPRQVREGYVDFILPWRTGGPKVRPFFALCILF